MILNRNLNPDFKQVQPLPALTAAMMTGAGGLETFRPTRPTRPTPALGETRPTTPPTAVRQLPQPRADQGTGERAMFSVLALSALFCVAQAFATMATWTPNAPVLTARVGQLLV